MIQYSVRSKERLTAEKGTTENGQNNIAFQLLLAITCKLLEVGTSQRFLQPGLKSMMDPAQSP